MSKFIPCNQKHLTLDSHIYIENELNKVTIFKDIASFLCKDATALYKEVKSHHLSDYITKVLFAIPVTSVYIVIIAEKQMPVENLFCMV